MNAFAPDNGKRGFDRSGIWSLSLDTMTAKVVGKSPLASTTIRHKAVIELLAPVLQDDRCKRNLQRQGIASEKLCAITVSLLLYNEFSPKERSAAEMGPMSTKMQLRGLKVGCVCLDCLSVEGACCGKRIGHQGKRTE